MNECFNTVVWKHTFWNIERLILQGCCPSNVWWYFSLYEGNEGFMSLAINFIQIFFLVNNSSLSHWFSFLFIFCNWTSFISLWFGVLGYNLNIYWKQNLLITMMTILFMFREREILPLIFRGAIVPRKGRKFSKHQYQACRSPRRLFVHWSTLSLNSWPYGFLHMFSLFCLCFTYIECVTYFVPRGLPCYMWMLGPMFC